MIIEDGIIESIRIRFNKLAWTLDERMRRLFAAAEASALGRGGITKVAQATGVSRRAIHVGLQELSDLKEPVENPLSDEFERKVLAENLSSKRMLD